MKRIIVVALLVALVACLFAGCADNRVEAVVISCEEGTPYVNGAAKTQQIINFTQGKYSQAMMWGAAAQPQKRYDVVVEYEGVQYEITTSQSYDVGETIKVSLPING